MEFLKPALLFTAIACAILSTSFFYVWLTYTRRNFTLFWALAWLAAVPHLACSWAMVDSPGVGSLQIADQLLLVANAFLMVCGCCDFVYRRIPWRQLLLIAIPFVAWGVLAPLNSTVFAGTQLPNALLLGGSYLWTSWSFFHLRVTRRTRGATVVAVLFAAAGLHEFDYPLFGNVPGAAPVGYGTAAVLAMGIAISLLILILEESRADVDEERARLHGVLDALPVGVIMFGSDGVPVFDNHAARTLLGETAATTSTSVQALASRLEAPLEGPNHAPEGEMPMVRSLRTGEICAPQEFALIDAASTRRAVLVNTAPVRDARARQLGVVTVLQDVEEWKQFERQMVRTQRLEALGTLAAGVAHNFNNNLMLILGHAQLGLQSTGDRAALVRLEAIGQIAQDSVGIVSRIQDLARARPAEAPSATAFDLSTLVRDVVELARPRWKDEAATGGVHYAVETRLQEGVGISGHPGELREAILNLVINALDAMPAGGTLNLTVAGQDAVASLRVTDSGEGMAPDVRDRIFDPFFTTKGVKGTGLGLSLVFGVVERHHGRIAVESEPGAGTTFTLSFPAAAVSAQADVEGPAQLPSEEGVLVVDDDPALRRLSIEMLTLMGYRAEAADSGEAALHLIEEARFDLVLTDLGMPGVTGWDIAAHAARVRPGLPVILMTGWGQTISEAECREKSIAAVLAKPFTLKQLAAAVNKAAAGRLRPACAAAVSVDR